MTTSPTSRPPRRASLLVVLLLTLSATAACVPDTGAPATPTPPAPTVTAAHIGGGTIRLIWAAPAWSGATLTMEVAIDGGAWRGVAPTGSIDVNTGYSAVHSIQARATAGGSTGPVASAAAVAPAQPAGVVVKFRGPANPVSSGTCPAGRCAVVGASLANFAPNSTHSVNCDFGPTYSIPPVTATVDRSGSWTGLTRCYVGNDTAGITVNHTTYYLGPVTWWT